MTYQIEGNCMGNWMQPFLVPREVTQGHQGSLKVKNQQFSRWVKWPTKLKEISGGIEWGHRRSNIQHFHDTKLTEIGIVHEDQTGPKLQYGRTKLARRASTSGFNWPEVPVSQN